MGGKTQRNTLVTCPPHTRQTYEQKSEQNTTPNAAKQGKFGSFGALFLFIFCGGWGFKTNPPKDPETLTSLNKESRPFFLGDRSIWSFPSVSCLSDCSMWRSWKLLQPCDHSIWSIWVHCPQNSLGKMEKRSLDSLIYRNLTKTLQPPTMDRVCAKQEVWSPNPLFWIMRAQNHTKQAD